MESITEYAGLVILDPKASVFSPAEGGYLDLKIGDKTYTKVRLARALPYQLPEEYISVTDRDGSEIGLIRKVADFPEDQKALILSELARFYYSPKLLKILSSKDKMGYLTMETETNCGKKEITVRDPSHNIRFLDQSHSNAVQVTDVDGNRYLIDDFAAFDYKSAKKIEAFLV